MWDRRINVLDWLAIVLTLVLAGLTIWAASYPIPGTDVMLFAAIGWSSIAILWAVGVLATVTGRIPTVAAALLLVGAIASFPLFGFVFLLYIFGGTAGLILAATTAAALLGVVVITSRVKHTAWSVAPSIVLVAAAIMFSGVPRLARMAASEAELNAFAETVDPAHGRAAPLYFDDVVVVGSVPVSEAFVSRGAVHLVTGYVGILGDDGAGIAYFPDGAPSADPPYEHLIGKWYRWFPY